MIYEDSKNQSILVPFEEYKELLQIKGKYELINNSEIFKNIKENQRSFNEKAYKLFDNLFNSILKDKNLKEFNKSFNSLYVDKTKYDDEMLLEVCNSLNAHFMMVKPYKYKYKFVCILEKNKEEYRIQYKIEVINN